MYGPSKICGRQPLKNLKRWSTQADHSPSNFLKAVFHKFYLVHSWILCPICWFLVVEAVKRSLIRKKKALVYWWRNVLIPFQISGNFMSNLNFVGASFSLAFKVSIIIIFILHHFVDNNLSFLRGLVVGGLFEIFLILCLSFDWKLTLLNVCYVIYFRFIVDFASDL